MYAIDQINASLVSFQFLFEGLTRVALFSSLGQVHLQMVKILYTEYEISCLTSDIEGICQTPEDLTTHIHQHQLNV